MNSSGFSLFWNQIYKLDSYQKDKLSFILSNSCLSVIDFDTFFHLITIDNTAD